MKLFSVFAVILTGLSAQADVITLKVENAYYVQLTGKDFESFRAALPQFQDMRVQMRKPETEALTIFNGYFDSSKDTFATFVFDSLDQEAWLNDPTSPYRRLVKEDGSSSRIRLYLSNAQRPEIEALYDALQVSAVQRKSKWDKTWKSEDGTFKIFCTLYSLPIAGYTHTCAISVVEPKE